MPVEGSLLMNRDELKRSWKPWLRGTAIGFPIGALPAGGAEIPTFLSYNLEKRLNPQGAVGQGRHRGRRRARGGQQRRLLRRAGAAADARHPDLGDGRHPAGRVPDLQPPARAAALRRTRRTWSGRSSPPVRRQRHAALLNLPLIRLWVKILSIPRPLLYAAILVFATLGRLQLSELVRRRAGDVRHRCHRLLHAALRLPGWPDDPGRHPGADDGGQFRRALQVSQGDLTVFVTRPISAVLLLIARCALLVPYVPSLLGRGKRLVFGSGSED